MSGEREVTGLNLEKLNVHERGRGKVLTVGLDPEVAADLRARSTQRHTNGAVEAQRQETDYHGGPSAVDALDL